MTVSAQTPINRSAGNGVTTVFPYTFKIISEGDIEVTVDDVVKTLNVDYTVTGEGSDAGGNVTMTTAPASGTTVVRRRNMAIVRTTDYQDQGSLPAATLDLDIDSTVLMVQQLDERLDRTFSLPASSAADSTMPAPTGGYVLGWDALGENLVNLPATAGTSLIDLAASSGSSLIGFEPSGTGAVATTVQTKLRETVSIADRSTPQQAMTDSFITLPESATSISSGLVVTRGLEGKSAKHSQIVPTANTFDAVTMEATTADFQRISDLSIIFPSIGTGDGIVLADTNNNVEISRVNIQKADVGVNAKYVAFMQRYQQVRVDYANTGFYAQGLNSGGTGAGTTLIYDQCYCTNGVVTGWDLNNVRSVEMIQPTTDMAGMTDAIDCAGVGVLNVFGHHFEGTPGANGSFINYTTSGTLSHGINIIGGALENNDLSALTYNYLNIQANTATVRVVLIGVNARNLTGGANAKLAKLSSGVGGHIEIIAINCDFGALEGLFDTTALSGTYSYRRIDKEKVLLATGSASVTNGGTITTGVTGGTDGKIIFVQVRKDDTVIPTVAAHVTETYSGNSNIQIKYTKLSDGTADAGTYTVNWMVML